MTARRKKRSYGSPPEMHERKRDEMMATARAAQARANRAIDDGRCDDAFDSVLRASSSFGAARTHDYAAVGVDVAGRVHYQNRELDSLRERIDYVEQNFYDHCVKRPR